MEGRRGVTAAEMCSLCGEAEASASWGLPVCDGCASWLQTLDATLAEMEAANPELARLRRRVDAALAEEIRAVSEEVSRRAGDT